MEAVEFSFKPSRGLHYFLALIYGGTCLILCFLSLPLLIKIGGIALLYYSFGKSVKRQVKRTTPEAIISLWQGLDGKWGYQTKGGYVGTGRLSLSSFRSSLFVVVRLKRLGKVVSIFIPHDALSPSEYRTLCTRLSFFNS